MVEFQRAVVQQQIFVATEFPPKEVWIDWATLVKSNQSGLKRALKDARKQNPGYTFRGVVVE